LSISVPKVGILGGV